MLRKILKLSAYQLAVYLSAPVLLAALLVLLERPLSGFLILQLFVEGFVVWQVAIGLVLNRVNPDTKLISIFVFNMTVGVLYRLTTNVNQIFVYLDTGQFSFFHVPAWVVPVHLYATLGVVYCFYLNARWILHAEEKFAIPHPGNTANAFFCLLVFPVGLWFIQPRLNKIAERTPSR